MKKVDSNLIESKVKVILSLLEERDPLAADIAALDSTVKNMRNYFAAGDLEQAMDYAQLIGKQAADVTANITTMHKANAAADQVHMGGAEEVAVDEPVSSFKKNPEAEITPEEEEFDDQPVVEEGKLPQGEQLENNMETIETLAEKVYLVTCLKLKEAKKLSIKERIFIKKVEAIKLSEADRKKIAAAVTKLKKGK